MYQGGSSLATSAVVRFRTTPLGANEGAEAHAAQGGIFRGAQPCYIRLDFRCRVTSCTSKTGHPAGGRGITLRRSVPRRLLVSNGRSVGETTVVMAWR